MRTGQSRRRAAGESAAGCHAPIQWLPCFFLRGMGNFPAFFRIEQVFHRQSVYERRVLLGDEHLEVFAAHHQVVLLLEIDCNPVMGVVVMLVRHVDPGHQTRGFLFFQDFPYFTQCKFVECDLHGLHLVFYHEIQGKPAFVARYYYTISFLPHFPRFLET
jgi:hypothetical protein